MYKLKIKLYLFICLFVSSFSESKACTDIEKFGFNISEISTKNLVSQYIMIDEDERKKILQSISDDNKDCFTFGTLEDNKKSFNKWNIYSRALYELTKLGDKNSKKILLEEFESRRHRLEFIGSYVYNEPYHLCLVGIWNQVATYDKEERNKLIEELEKGEIIPQDINLLTFWKNYISVFKEL